MNPMSMRAWRMTPEKINLFIALQCEAASPGLLEVSKQSAQLSENALVTESGNGRRIQELESVSTGSRGHALQPTHSSIHAGWSQAMLCLVRPLPMTGIFPSPKLPAKITELHKLERAQHTPITEMLSPKHSLQIASLTKNEKKKKKEEANAYFKAASDARENAQEQIDP